MSPLQMTIDGINKAKRQCTSILIHSVNILCDCKDCVENATTKLELLLLHYTRLKASFQDNLGKPEPERGKTNLDLNETRDDGVLGWRWPYANNLHLAPDR